MTRRCLMILLYSVVFGIALYFFMTRSLKMSIEMAENRSILMVSLIHIYMIMFGHGMPVFINPNL